MTNELDTYRTIARALAPYVASPNALISATDAVISVTRPPAPIGLTATGRNVYVHSDLVNIALNNSEVMHYVALQQKINAIKELRQITNCGLKEAKDAIEDDKVWGR